MSWMIWVRNLDYIDLGSPHEFCVRPQTVAPPSVVIRIPYLLSVRRGLVRMPRVNRWSQMAVLTPPEWGHPVRALV